MQGSKDVAEFTEEELRAALKRVGKEARDAAFAAGRPIMIARAGNLLLRYPDGTEEIVGSVDEATDDKCG